MEHILTECDAPGRTIVWALANELWSKNLKIERPNSHELRGNTRMLPRNLQKEQW